MQTKLANPKQEHFAQLLVAKRLSNADAYKGAYGEEKTTEVASAAANRLLKNVKVAKRVGEIEDSMQAKYEKAAKRGLEIQQEIMEDKQSPANVRVQASKDFQDRAGYGAVQKVEQTNSNKYTSELVDDFARDEKMQMLSALDKLAEAKGTSSEVLQTLVGFDTLQWEETRTWNEEKKCWDYTTRLKL